VRNRSFGFTPRDKDRTNNQWRGFLEIGAKSTKIRESHWKSTTCFHFLWKVSLFNRTRTIGDRSYADERETEARASKREGWLVILIDAKRLQISSA